MSRAGGPSTDPVAERPSPIAVHDPAPVEVVGGELVSNSIARRDPDPVAAHPARRVAESLVTVVEQEPVHPVAEGLEDLALQIDLLFLAGDRAPLLSAAPRVRWTARRAKPRRTARVLVC